MSKLALKNNPILRSQQALNALIAVAHPYLSLDLLQNTRITAEDIIAVLGYASANRVSIDAACQELKEAPSANRLREVLAQALPDLATLQRALNTILRAQTPRFVKKGKRAYYIAIDLTLIPYHGEPYADEKEIVRSQPKSGTTHFHGYATVSIVQALVCDDAPQFKWLTRWLALCWIHEGRHYAQRPVGKKLEPVVALHQTLLKDYLTRFWNYYDQLLKYRLHPTAQEALRLEAEFYALFGTPSGYAELDKRIASTRSHKDALLLVLKFPELPLYNNPAELGARGRVRKRDVSFGPRTEDGKQAWDTFMTLAATTKKLKVSFYECVCDRILKKNGVPPLSDLITKAAHDLILRQSYSLACP